MVEAASPIRQCVVDTSWLIAFVRENDKDHAKARQQAKELEVVHIPAAIWVEFQNVFQYRFKRHGEAITKSQEIRTSRGVEVGDRIDDDAAREIWTRHPELTYTDAAAVAEAKRRRWRLCTFEQRQLDALAEECPDCPRAE